MGKLCLGLAILILSACSAYPAKLEILSKHRVITTITTGGHLEITCITVDDGSTCITEDIPMAISQDIRYYFIVQDCGEIRKILVLQDVFILYDVGDKYPVLSRCPGARQERLLIY